MAEATQVLFEITEENLETGMRGYPVGYCITSSVDPQKGLTYIGKSITELAFKEPVEVIYLLYYGEEGTPEKIKTFTKDLQNRSRLSPKTIEHIRKLPREGHPMKLFCTALLVTGMIEGKNDYREDCLNLIAKLPEIAATVINYHHGTNGNPSKPELGYMENFTQMLGLPQSMVEIFKLFNILHYDHGGGNLSCFTGKAIASGLEDMYGSIAGAMTALAGPRHGRANQDCLEFVQEVLKALGENATPQQVEQYIRKKLDSKELVFGFGHAVLRVEDPRATIFYDVAQKYFPTHPLVKITKLLRTEGPKVLKENPKISDPYPNIDAISGTLLTAAGFPHSQCYTILFGLARCVGISRQIVYERCEARDGKGTPIVRPKYIYKPRG